MAVVVVGGEVMSILGCCLGSASKGPRMRLEGSLGVIEDVGDG